MTDYTVLANAIKATLTADEQLGNVANVKTIESRKRGFSVQSNSDALFFGDAELPALAIIPNARGKQTSLSTTNEARETHTAQIVVISRDRDAQAGLDAQSTIVENVERVMEAQRSSSDNLGIDAFVRSVSSTDEQFKKGDHYYFATTVEAQIELTATF